MWIVLAILTATWAWSPLSHSLQHPQSTRADRFLSLFTLIRFKNSECRSLGSDMGICYAYPECRRGGGQPSGDCAAGYGACCVTKLGCSSSTSNNCSYIESPGYPSSFNYATTCTHTITFSTNVCQVRMEVVDVDLAPPTTQGICNDDSLTFSQDIKWEKVCGTTTDTHFYLEVDPSASTSLTLTFNTGTASYPRKWKMKLCQVCCDQISLAPSGCGQYFTTSSGTIKGWNYGGIYLSGQNYAICVRRELNSCSTTYLDLGGMKFRPICGDTFEWPYPVGDTLTSSVACVLGPAFLPPAPITVPLQGPNYLYLVTKDATNDHSLAEGNVYYNFTQNSC